jgi:hypothetical protein
VEYLGKIIEWRENEMILLIVNPKADRRGALLQCFSECLVEIDLTELALREPEVRGAPLYCLEGFIKTKLEAKK